MFLSQCALLWLLLLLAGICCCCGVVCCCCCWGWFFFFFFFFVVCFGFCFFFFGGGSFVRFLVCLFVGLFVCVCVFWLLVCVTPKQHANVSQERIFWDNWTCCHTEIVVADQTYYLAQSQYTDTGATSFSAYRVAQDAWQVSHYSTNFPVAGMTRPGKSLTRKAGLGPAGLLFSRRTPYH